MFIASFRQGMSLSSHIPILLFDGCCPFCNFVVRIISRLDRHRDLRFAPIESELGRGPIQRHSVFQSIDSAFLLYYDERDNERIAAKSDMLALLADYISWPGKILLLPFKVIPNILGDWLYDAIARNRNRLFGRYESCPIPPKEWRSRFLSTKI